MGKEICKHRYKIISTNPELEIDRKCDICWEINIQHWFPVYIENWYIYITDIANKNKNKINENWYFIS